MYHIGIGPTQLSNFLSVINLPIPASKTIQRRCDKVGSTLEKLATESTNKALQKELELSTEGTCYVRFKNTICMKKNKEIKLKSEF